MTFKASAAARLRWFWRSAAPVFAVQSLRSEQFWRSQQSGGLPRFALLFTLIVVCTYYPHRLSSHGVLGTSDASANTVTRYRWAVRNEIFRFIHRECRTSQQARHFKIIPMISSQRRRFAAAWHSLEHSCRKLFTSNHSRSISLAGNIRPTFRGDVGLKFFYKLFGKLLNVDSY